MICQRLKAISYHRTRCLGYICKQNVIQRFFVSLVTMSAYRGLNHYMLSMIKSFSFDSVDANALNYVPVYCSMVWTLVLVYLSRLTGPLCSICVTGYCIECHCIFMSEDNIMRLVPNMVSFAWPMSPISACSMFIIPHNLD